VALPAVPLAHRLARFHLMVALLAFDVIFREMCLVRKYYVATLGLE
jgi:hypothetical protein